MFDKDQNLSAYRASEPAGMSFFSKNKIFIFVGIGIGILIIGFLIYWFGFRQTPEVTVLTEQQQGQFITEQPSGEVPSGGEVITEVKTYEDIMREELEKPLEDSGDEDGDGLDNLMEKTINTDPRNIDSDEDRLNDYDEFIVIGSDPLSDDTDKDGVSDYDEIVEGTDPLGSELFTERLNRFRQSLLGE